MAINILIIIVYAASAAASVKMYQALVEAYPRLPEQIPVHFNLSGEPDRWTKKRRAAIWFMPLTALFCSLTIFACFFALPLIMDGDIFPEFAAAGALLSASLAWLMFSVNRGIIAVALEQEPKINRFVYPPLLIVVIASLLPAIIPFIISGETSFQQMVTCRSIGRHAEPEQVSDTFSIGDERIYVSSRWRSLNSGKLMYEWYDPAGDLYFDHEIEFNLGRNMRLVRRPYSYINVAGTDAVNMPGVWTVRLFYNDEVIDEVIFNLK